MRTRTANPESVPHLPSTTRISRALTGTALLLVAFSITGQIAAQWLTPGGRAEAFAHFWSLDSEQNVPTFFSMLLMLGTSALLTLNALRRKHAGDADWTRWAVLAGGFLLMAYDEVCQVHEGVVAPLREWLGPDRLGFLYFAWVIPGFVLVLAVAAVFWKFVTQLPPPLRRSVRLGAMLFLGGALGVEILSGPYAERHGNLTAGYDVISTVEETLELAGLIVFITGLLRHYRGR